MTGNSRVNGHERERERERERKPENPIIFLRKDVMIHLTSESQEERGRCPRSDLASGVDPFPSFRARERF